MGHYEEKDTEIQKPRHGKTILEQTRFYRLYRLEKRQKSCSGQASAVRQDHFNQTAGNDDRRIKTIGQQKRCALSIPLENIPCRAN